MFKILPPYNILYKMESGAFQEIQGIVEQGCWQIKNIEFSVFLPYNNGKTVHRIIDQSLACLVNWNKVIEYMTSEDYKNLPSPADIKDQEILPLLVSLGVASVETNTTTVVNGEYLQYTKINESYLMIYSENQFSNIIDITDTIQDIEEKE